MAEDKRDNRLHKLVELIIAEEYQKGIKYDWNYEELRSALGGRTNLHEVKHLCEILSEDQIVELQSEGVHLSHVNLANARQAFHGNEYREKTKFWSLGFNAMTAFVTLGLLLFTYKTVDLWYKNRGLEIERRQLTREKDSLLRVLEKKQSKGVPIDSLKLKR